MIDYSHAEYADYNEIQSFIKEYWASDHILSHDKEVFDHFFVNINKLQFFLAKDSKSNIVGILGYITNSQFDRSIKQEIAWLSMWMVKVGLREPVGIKLLKFLEDNLNVGFVASLGVGSLVIPLYQRLGYETGSMTHLMKSVIKKGQVIDSDYLITQDFHGENETVGIGEKSNLYLKQKYLISNFYDYSIFYVYENDFYIASIVGRILYDPTSKKSIFRIVDFAGDRKGLSIFAENISSSKFFKNIDYIDILLSEILLIEDEVFETCSSQKYLPLYFEPFISDYRKKNFCFKRFKQCKNQNLLIITGDCDQERPNKRDSVL